MGDRDGVRWMRCYGYFCLASCSKRTFQFGTAESVKSVSASQCIAIIILITDTPSLEEMIHITIWERDHGKMPGL